MNTSTLKSYAPEARQAFITAVSAQATRLGISATEIQPAQAQGDVLLIAGQAFPLTINESRNKLVEQVRAHGFDATMDAVAYTWFNRFVAIRYMELHGYLDHGYRVLSHPEGLARPEILDHAADVELPGLDKAKAIELKLDGTQDEALYRLLLKAQCNALHQAMPFLFEKIGDETELLLPANLLHSDSLIRQLVEQVEETLWEDIEIIGWLYQFYISEKKDQVIGKVVKSEDIPAATQLFTPNWIVKYMVQNSLGAQWLATYPQSPLKGQMEYYIEPAKQTDAVNAQLAEITPSQLNPEALTLIDPASGSGHILVEAYELFKAIYLERGYRLRDVPQLILEKNLFGLDIDQRAAQLTGFALMMKGRADDRRLFARGVKLNVMALVDSTDFDAEGLSQNVKLADYGLKPGHLTELKQLFEHATTFGSLIQVPTALAEKLPALKQLSATATSSTDLFTEEALKCLGPLVQQAKLLAAQYDAVVANPPYMGSKFYCAALKDLVNASFKAGKSDLYGAFTLRNIQLAKELGYVGMITIPNWMFLSSFKDFRDVIFEEAPISSLVHNGRGIWGSDFGSCSYVLQRSCPNSFCGKFLRLFEKQGSVANNTELEQRFHANPRFTTANSDFRKIPGKPVAYWASEDMKSVFETCSPFSDFAKAKKGMFTGNNERFLRYFWEVAELYQSCQSHEQSKECSLKWYPYQKGGEFRKWYGNREYVVNFQHDGLELRESGGYGERSPETYFRAAITWNDITAAQNAFRMSSSGFLYDGRGPGAFLKVDSPVTQLYLLGLLNTRLVRDVLLLLNPTLSVNIGEISNIPVFALGEDDQRLISDVVEECILLSQTDWDGYERSWNFQSLPLRTASSDSTSPLESSYISWITQNRDTIAEMKRLEEANNRLFIEAYGLSDELTPDVPIEQITLTVNPAYRYGKKLSEEELWTRFRQDSMEELVSYAIGCMMGRYSLDAPGLIYAHSGNADFDATRYTTFPADDDGIVPLSDTEWFDDDAANRLVEFISVAWDASQLEANLTFLADNLSPKANESSRDTIRRYLCDSFYKKHTQTYKKRPIYWLFTSGKQKAFSCLVYLHRYNEGSLSRMRSEYVIPLQGKMASRLEQLKGDIQSATSTAHSKRLEKEQTKLEKQQVELIAFDEKLRHYADKRIALDLDDGVKVNYGQFGDLLAEVKAIHGKKV